MEKLKLSFKIHRDTCLELTDINNYEDGIEGDVKISCGNYCFPYVYITSDDEPFLSGYWLEMWFESFLEMLKSFENGIKYYGFNDPESPISLFEFKKEPNDIVIFSVLKSQSSSMKWGVHEERPEACDLEINYSAKIKYNDLKFEIIEQCELFQEKLLVINKELLNTKYLKDIFSLKDEIKIKC